MSAQIPTPRTDDICFLAVPELANGEKEECVSADDCRMIERELAKERTRLDFMSTRGFEHRHHETGDHLAYEWTISSTNEDKSVSLREVIDAAMKEAGL